MKWWAKPQDDGSPSIAQADASIPLMDVVHV